MLMLSSLLTIQAFVAAIGVGVDQGLKRVNRSDIFVLLLKRLPTDVPSFLVMPSVPPLEHASDVPLVQPLGMSTSLPSYLMHLLFVLSHLQGPQRTCQG